MCQVFSDGIVLSTDEREKPSLRGTGHRFKKRTLLVLDESAISRGRC